MGRFCHERGDGVIEFPNHAANPYFGVADGDLMVGGRTVSALAQEYGTPLYVYDAGVIKRRLAELRQALPEKVSLHYAVKANPYPPLVNLIASAVDGLDVASSGELRVAIESGTSAENISFAGPGKTVAELEHAVDFGCVINVESVNELHRIVRICEETGERARVAIRVNPDFELKGSGMRMSGGAKPFGIDAECVPEVLDLIASMPVRFEGFHIFSGSQCLKWESIADAQTQALNLAYRLGEGLAEPPRLLNVGGGFGIPYFPGEEPLDLAKLGDSMSALLERHLEHWPGTELVVELGRYIVGQAGLYVCEVVDRKVSRGQVFLVTNGGLHHHLAASGNFGQVLRKNYPIAIGNQMDGGSRESVSVVGPLCTPLDLLGDRMELPRADCGDLVVLFQSGAYGYTASPLGFLSHPGPGEVLIGND